MEAEICKEVCADCHRFHGVQDFEQFEKEWESGFVFCIDAKNSGYFLRNHSDAAKKCENIVEHFVVGQKGENREILVR